MPIRHAIWKVGAKPVPLSEQSLGNEALLEQMIIENPAILSDHWMVIGQQVHTTGGGVIDLLALNQDGQLIVIELKRDRAPKDVISQALGYATYAQSLRSEGIEKVYYDFARGKSIWEEFEKHFGVTLDDKQLDGSHQLVVVAASLDPSTQRIVEYLSSFGVPINVISFQVFGDGESQYLSRAWLIDPVETETKASSGPAGPKVDWNGEYYASFGQSQDRDWSEAVKFGFICAGGGTWYSQTLRLLSPGDRVWVNIPKRGYVGVGKVLAPSVRASDFHVDAQGKKRPFLEVAKASYHRDYAEDEEKSEYFVAVEWIEARKIEDAVSEVGLYGIQHSVCRPRTPKWVHTVERLKQHFKTVS